jgi:adenylate kinase
LRGYFCITGTPGTGKKTIAPAVASLLRVSCYGLNELATQYGIVRTRKTGEVDPVRLGNRIREKIGGRCVLFGHLIPYALEQQDVARVVVLRCDPRVLKARLKGRTYSRAKVVDNVEAELIGVIAADSVKSFGHAKVVEFDNSDTPVGEAVKKVAKLLSTRNRRPDSADWLRSYDSPEKLRLLLAR